MNNNRLAHNLKTRHILMIALGSAIGTGLFFGAGQSIKLAGPSILLAYAIGGLVMYIVIRALGEMIVHEPNSGSFSYYAHKYINNYVGFISGWNYWFNYIIVSMLELTAATMFLTYWFPHTSHWLMALNILVIFAAINLMNVKSYGEFEFWFAGIKVVVIIAMIIFGIYLVIDKSNHESSIQNLWSYGGFFANGYIGFLLSFVVVVFSFGGTELVGITAGEAENPGKTIPMAINGIIFRIIIFYIATLTIILCLYPWNKINNHLSPFVDVFQKIGIQKAADVMNFVAITAALSSLNSGIYGTARMSYSLAKQKHAPQILTKLGKNGIPYMAIFFSLFFIFIAVILNYLFPKQLFLILLSIATTAAMINWIIILVTQMYFRKKVSQNKINYKMPFYPYTSIIAIIFFIVVCISMTQMKDMALAIYIAPLWLCLLSAGFGLKKYFANK